MELSQSLREYITQWRQKPDTEFMPEVDGTLLEDSPTLARITVWLVSLLLLTALVWAKFAVLEEVTMGEARPFRRARSRSSRTWKAASLPRFSSAKDSW